MNTNIISPQCAAQSIGPVNYLFSTMLQFLLAKYCEISSPDLWPEDYGAIADKEEFLIYDFIVIGAGTAGSVVASRLSENPNWKVLLLEAGGDPPIESEIPNMFFTLQHTLMDWQYSTTSNGKSCFGMKNRNCYLPRGKILGGTGAINGMIHLQGNRKDYDQWRDLGNPTWGWNEILPYFKKSLKNSGGYLPVNSFNGTHAVKDIIKKAAQELGQPIVEEFNEGSFCGYSEIKLTQENGKRFSTAKAFLSPAKSRPNLHVIKNAVAKKINFDRNGKAISVDFVYKEKQEMRAFAKNEIVLSAGAINSPKLLMLSGIGPQQHLESLQIPLVRNLEVGRNLQDHVAVPLSFHFKKSIGQESDVTNLFDAIYKYLMHGDGLLADPGTLDLTAFINVMNSSKIYPDVEIHYITLPTQTPFGSVYAETVGISESVAKSILNANSRSEVTMAYITLLNPESKGWIRLKSKSFKDAPEIFPNYLDRNEDVNVLLEAIRYQIQFESTKTMREVGGKLLQIDIPACKVFQYLSTDYLKCYIRYMSTSVYHPSGTVKMGPSEDKTAVVDWRLRVHGLKGLRVVDASIMPRIVSANINAATIMIAEKGSDFIKEEWLNRNSES